MMTSLHEGALADEEFGRVSREFMDGCMRTSGLSQDQALVLWERVSSFTGFSFCKSHSASYAQLSFKCAWLKAHYPAQFLASVISNNHGFYSRDTYIDDPAHPSGWPPISNAALAVAANGLEIKTHCAV